MKSETTNLAALVQLALQEKTITSVRNTEITNALAALESALEILPFSGQGPVDTNAQLKQAAHILSGLLYLLTSGIFWLSNNSCKNLTVQAGRLHKEINGCLHRYYDMHVIQYELLPVKTLVKILSGINSALKNNDDIAELYIIIKPCLEEIQPTKLFAHHRWLWWAQFAAMYTAISNSFIAFPRNINNARF